MIRLKLFEASVLEWVYRITIMSGSSASFNKTQTTDRLLADTITTAVASFFLELGDAFLFKFTLEIGRHVDLISLSCSRHVSIIKVKTSPSEFSSDKKWPEYLDWLDQFYFATRRYSRCKQ